MDLKVSEILFQVIAAKYFTEFLPRRVVLGFGTCSFLTPLRFLMSRFLVLTRLATSQPHEF